MSIESVKIKEFTIFNDVDINFASGINVIIGENGTGKTHLMKLLYAQMNFVATHNFIFAKYVEVLMKEHDQVAFHALYKTEKEGVKCETKDKFVLLTHNAIREENINIYDAEMKKEME